MFIGTSILIFLHDGIINIKAQNRYMNSKTSNLMYDVTGGGSELYSDFENVKPTMQNDAEVIPEPVYTGSPYQPSVGAGYRNKQPSMYVKSNTNPFK